LRFAHRKAGSAGAICPGRKGQRMYKVNTITYNNVEYADIPGIYFFLKCHGYTNIETISSSATTYTITASK